MILQFFNAIFAPFSLDFKTDHPSTIQQRQRRELFNRDTILIFLGMKYTSARYWSRHRFQDITFSFPLVSFAYSHKRRFRFTKLGMLQPIGKVASSKRDKFLINQLLGLSAGDMNFSRCKKKGMKLEYTEKLNTSINED